MTRATVGAAFAVVLWLGMPAPGAAQQRCARPVARFQSVTNSVQVLQASTRVPGPATRLLPVCAGDTIRVGDNSRAVVLMIGSNTPLAIDQNSEFTVAESPDRARSLLDLVRGAVLFVSGTHRSIDIRTPFVNASVEGTEFIVRVAADRTLITVLEGAVRASNPQGTVLVAAGQQATAVQGRAPQLQVVVRPRDAVQWALYYEPILPADSFDRLATVADTDRDATFYVRRASLYLGVRQLDAARDDLDRAAQLDPSNGQADALRTIIAIALNDKATALDSARTAVARAPGSAAAQVALSYALQAAVDLPGARAAVEKAVALEPENAGAWARLAELRLSLGDTSGAAQAARRSTTLAREDARGFTVLGFVSLAQMNMSGAQTAFDAAITLESDNPWAQAGLGLVQIRRGRLTDGRASLETAVTLSPDNALLRSYLGKAYFDEHRDDAARAQFDAAKSLDPLDPTPWFYQGLASQATNQPVTALGEFERAEDLNDNRAVYRSRLLLDADLAARTTRTARTYRDLGFEQLALVEGWRALADDPSNSAAHRLLADSYLALPGVQIARDSELLQAQLLQPINLNPVQPRLADNGLAFLDDPGITAVGFNEFTRLFAANQVRVVEDGVAGRQSTVGNNAIVSGIFNRVSFSAGQFHFDSDGVRENNDVRQDIENAFVQVALPGNTSAQVEVRAEDADNGDRRMLFDRSNYVAGLRNPYHATSVRLGGAHTVRPGQTLIASYVHRDGDSTLDSGTGFRVLTSQTADFAEGRYLQAKGTFNATGGVGLYRGRSSESASFGPLTFPTSLSTITHVNAYGYGDIRVMPRVTMLTGLSVESYDDGQVSRTPVNPKFGVIWTPTDATTVRAAAFRTFKRTLISSQTLEPTEVAGFNQFVDDPNSTTAWRYAVAVDRRLTHEAHAGVEASFRRLSTLQFDAETQQAGKTDSEERLATAYLYVTPTNWLAVSAKYRLDGFVGDPSGVNERLTAKSTAHIAAFEARVFARGGLFARARTSAVRQTGRFLAAMSEADPGPVVFQGADRFWVVDASGGYRLPSQRGVVAIDIRNAMNRSFAFQDVNPQEPSFLPRRQILARLTLAF